MCCVWNVNIVYIATVVFDFIIVGELVLPRENSQTRQVLACWCELVCPYRELHCSDNTNGNR